jgi:hypothetical protein
VPNAAPPSDTGERTRRTLVGKEVLVGVAGSTLTDEWGDLCFWPEMDTAGDLREADEVDDALECEWW